MTARVLMVQGTSSSVGKSLMTAALCRIYTRRGLRVAPFKSQNMSLNSYVTAAGHEIGRAQAVQAEAACTEPTVHMNPILLKPEGERRCQVVVEGKVAGAMTAAEYHDYKPTLKDIIQRSLDTLRASNDLVIIEGAGSPVEVNLKDKDIVNMFVADLADAPVVLVGDIDRGGVFASLVGTMELLEPHERDRVVGLIINKFRGDPALLGNGLDFLHQRTGVPVLGVVPHIHKLRIAEEDSTGLDERDRELPTEHPADAPGIRVAVVRFPYVSNYDDVLPLEREPGVHVEFTSDAQLVEQADLVVLPGSKSTVDDLRWLRRTKLDISLHKRASQGRPILGICGGCQMLGLRIDDVEGVESSQTSVPGLGLLEITTSFRTTKTTAQVVAKTMTANYLASTEDMVGYEIHSGDIQRRPGVRAPFRLHSRNGLAVDIPEGAVSDTGAVVGTMIHGILDNAGVRESLLTRLRPDSQVAARDEWATRSSEYDRLADTVSRFLSMERLDKILRISDPERSH